MWVSYMTGPFEDPTEATEADFWIHLSTLVPYKRIWLPLMGNSYVTKAKQVVKGISARKTRDGRWRFEACEKLEYEIPELPEEAKWIGVDVGLNVLAATSEGHTFGTDLKPKFDYLYKQVKKLRKNRQKQGLKENSPKLDYLEAKLSGLTKSFMGKVANEMIKQYPSCGFVMEDLHLKGCSGQKRFCYTGLQKALKRKAQVEVVNPAYSSQLCPSCGHVEKGNRHSTKFKCHICGRISHADIVGGINLLRRSEANQVDLENQITLEHHKSVVRRILARLYWARRNPGQDCPQDLSKELTPFSQKSESRLILPSRLKSGSPEIY